jgi:hypothetical protein
MRVLKVMILGFIILCLIYLTPPGLTKTGGDGPVSIEDENPSEPAADAGFDCAMPQATPFPNPNWYFLVYSGENYSGDARRVYVETENTHPLSFWDDDAIRLIDKYTGYPPMSHFVRNVPIKSIKLRVFAHVTLFEQENYKGYCLTITKDTPSFRRYVLPDIKSLKVGAPCPQNLSDLIHNVTIQNNGGTRIKYRLNVNGEWEPWSNPVRAAKSEARSVRSNQIVTVEIQYLYLTRWKDLCKHDLDWKRSNTITVKHTLTKIWCEKQ